MKKPLFTEEEVQKNIDDAINETIRKTGQKPSDMEIALANKLGYAFANWVNTHSDTIMNAFEKVVLEALKGKKSGSD
ncbi:MAG: hypothetical protein IJI10_02915 [Eubacterium sp.]|nr:hypothetical protein [Eubacterium sp.]